MQPTAVLNISGSYSQPSGWTGIWRLRALVSLLNEVWSDKGFRYPDHTVVPDSRVAADPKEAFRGGPRRGPYAEVEAVPCVKAHVAVATAYLALVACALGIAFASGDGIDTVPDRVAAPALLAVLEGGEAVSFGITALAASYRGRTVILPVFCVVYQGSQFACGTPVSDTSVSKYLGKEAGKTRLLRECNAVRTYVQHPVSTGDHSA